MSVVCAYNSLLLVFPVRYNTGGRFVEILAGGYSGFAAAVPLKPTLAFTINRSLNLPLTALFQGFFQPGTENHVVFHASMITSAKAADEIATGAMACQMKSSVSETPFTLSSNIAVLISHAVTMTT